MVEYKPAITIHAKGNYHFGDSSIPVELSASYASLSSDSVEVKIWSDDKNISIFIDYAFNYPDFIIIDGQTDSNENIWIKGVYPIVQNGLDHLEAKTGIFIIGDLKTTISAGEDIHIRGITSSSPLIVPEWSYRYGYDGTITKLRDNDERVGVNWKNEKGQAKLIDSYDYFDSIEKGNELSVRVRTNSLHFVIDIDVETDIKTILFQFPKFIFDDLNLLSFIGRKRIVCNEASIRIIDDRYNISAFVRYQTWGGFYSLPTDHSILRSLIHPQKLKEGLFAELFSTYVHSPGQFLI
jgi:hypothetical protein